LAAASRHAFRPAHLHFMVKANGCEPLVTHVFVAGDQYLDSDAVFATKDSLIAAFSTSSDASEAQRFGIPVPFSRLRFDFGLMRH
jgi:hydroxyquinol 1,2-dioxygenase